MKCSCKALVAFAGGIAMISSAAVASPSTSDRGPSVSDVQGKKVTTAKAVQTSVSNDQFGQFTFSDGQFARGSNDTCAGAESVACGGSVVADLTLASPGVDVPFSCAVGAGHTNTLWYSFVATENAAIIETCNTAGATDSTLNVFSGNCGGLVEIGCGEDNCGFLSTTTVTGLNVGETYYIQIGAWAAGNVGSYLLEVNCFESTASGNDTCAGAEEIACGGSAEADLNQASPGIDVPFSCAIGTGHTNTLWYRFTATDNAATIQTCNSAAGNSDSTLNVFSGACGSLVEIGCNDDTAGCSASGFNSRATVTGLVPGETYYIQVGAWSAADVGTYLVEVDCFFLDTNCADCPAGAVDDGEQCIADGGEDVTNGGCNLATPLFTNVNFGDDICGRLNGYISAAGGNSRDLDWYTFTLTESTFIELQVLAEGPVVGFIAALPGGDCANLAVLTSGTAELCETLVLPANLAAGDYVAIIGVNGFGPAFPCFDYVASLVAGGQTPGACCDFDGNCAEVVEADCEGFFTPNATCAEVTCVSVECPPDGLVEGFGFGEDLFDGYSDDLNSGCNSASGIAIADFPVCGDVWCGTSGNHLNAAGGQVRDTDWYQLDLFETTTINWRVTGTFDVLSFILQAGPPGNECTFGFTQSATGPAGTAVNNIATLGAGTYYLFVSTQVFTGVPANSPYVAELICSGAQPQACCFGDGSCAEVLAPDCFAQGGIAQGDGVTCADSPCCVVCDGSEVLEGEPICEDGQTDTFNSGCNSPDGLFPTTPLSANTAVCGTTGNFVAASGAQTRDTDWYSYNHPGGPLTLTVQSAGFDALTGILNVLPDGSNCAAGAFLPGLVGFTDGCDPISLSGDLSAGTYIVFVSTADFTGTPCGFEYNLEVTTGDVCDPTCGDVTGDGVVNLSDLNLVLANFGQTTDNGDANCDGVVNLADLNLVLAQFGQTCN